MIEFTCHISDGFLDHINQFPHWFYTEINTVPHHIDRNQ